MNGRGLGFPCKGNRTSFWSTDDATSFTAPVAAPIKEDDGFGCSAALLSDSHLADTAHSVPARLFLSEPAAPDRVRMTVRCSLDGGHTWPYHTRKAVV